MERAFEIVDVKKKNILSTEHLRKSAERVEVIHPLSSSANIQSFFFSFSLFWNARSMSGNVSKWHLKCLTRKNQKDLHLKES